MANKNLGKYILILFSLNEAKNDLEKLLKIYPKNLSAKTELHKIVLEIDRVKDDERVKKLSDASLKLNTPSFYGGMKGAVAAILDKNNKNKTLAYNAVKESLQIDDNMRVFFSIIEIFFRM